MLNVKQRGRNRRQRWKIEVWGEEGREKKAIRSLYFLNFKNVKIFWTIHE